MSEYIIGIDVGGTNMRGILLDGEKILQSYTLSTPKNDLDKFYSFLKALIEPLVEKSKQNKKKITGIGLSVAGMHDFNKGKIIKSPNITYLNEEDICANVEKRLNFPVKFDNDANCFLRAEIKLGAGVKFKNAFGMTLGTGIGGAWWLNNKIYQGSHGGAGEVGHTLLYNSQIEEIEETYQRLTSNNPAQLAEQAYRGEDIAEKTFKQIGENLGIACANIVNLIDPEVIIIGGSAVKSSDIFLPVTKKKMRENIADPLSKNTKIIKAKLGDNAGAIGAALLYT